MKDCSITDVSEKTAIVHSLTNQYLVKRYFDITGECGRFEHAAVKLYSIDDDERPHSSHSFSLGLNKIRCESHCVSYPILYQRKQIGDLQIASARNSGQQQATRQPVEFNATKVARKIALLVKRDQASKLSGLYLGKSLSLQGYSDTVFNLEAFIENAAATSAPVIIQGGFGSEKLAVASSIHYNSSFKHQPFIEIICAEGRDESFRQKLINCFYKAKGGSIYLHGIDDLPMTQQNLLLELLAASSDRHSDDWPYVNTSDVRLLMSTTRSLSGLVNQNRFSKQLFAQINVLSVNIPSLHERREDLSAIIEQQLQRHRLYDEQRFSEEVESIMCHYHWPENYQQLERTIARLLALSSSNPINVEDLQRHAPEVLADWQNEPSRSQQQKVTSADVSTPCADATTPLIEHLLTGDFRPFNHLHSGLQKALKYLVANGNREITLTELAQNAYVSPSHLSYLLKFHLKRSFKQILAELRIERAKQMFNETPNVRITDVSLDVGFGDLSHFEKIFKRYTKLTPRQYRNRNKA